MIVTRYVKIALFFLVFGTAGVGYIIISSNGINQFNTAAYEVIIPDATGLSTRSKVYLAGVPVGKVEDIQLIGSEAKLKVSFLKSTEIRKGAKLTRKSSSILGTSVLALEPGPENAPLIPPGSMISPGLNAADMNAIMGTVTDLSSQISGILEEFQKNQMALIAIFMESANSIAYQIDIRTEAELERVTRILEATALITERTEKLLRENGGNIDASFSDVRGALADVQAITAEIRGGRGNIGQAIYGDQFYTSLLAATENTGAAAEKLSVALESINVLARNADGVLTSAGEIVDKALGLGIQIDSGANYNFLSQNVRAGASLRLEPLSADRWYRVGVTSIPDGLARRTTKETTVGGVTAFEDTTETSFSFAFDLELARRFGFLTLRGGLLESTAGIGLDIQPVHWVSLSGEFFNFKTGEAPNLRGYLTIYPFFNPDSDLPWNWIYLRGGVNNALSGKRDYFIGGGLRFADREVKGLVGLVPVLN